MLLTTGEVIGYNFAKGFGKKTFVDVLDCGVYLFLLRRNTAGVVSIVRTHARAKIHRGEAVAFQKNQQNKRGAFGASFTLYYLNFYFTDDT
jgi:hypothetical protein